MSQLINDIPTLPPRQPESHKGIFGKVLIIGGSRQMAGAPSLAGLAALRSGAGLVRIATPDSIQLSVAQMTPCATTIPLEEENGFIHPNARQNILNALGENDSVVVGPGLGYRSQLYSTIETIAYQCKKPLLIDADGLNCLAAIANQETKLPRDTILTPHPGEIQRLWQAWFRESLPNDRREQAETLSQKTNAIVVLKGHQTVVTDGNQTYINNTGNPGLATGGSGDCLSGTIGALLALGGNKKQLTPLQAATLGVWAHGKAADIAAETYGQIGLIATDLPEIIGKVLSDHAK